MPLTVTEAYYQNLLELATREDFPQALTRLQWGKRTILDPDFRMSVDDLWLYLRDREVPPEDIQALQRVKPPKAPRPPKGMSLVEFGESIGKPLAVGMNEGELESVSLHLKVMARAISTLPPTSRKLYQSEVRKVVLGRPKGTEDASWEPGGVLRLNLKAGSTPDLGVYRSRVIHELGHALEEKLGLIVTPWGTIYGNPPFISDYARVNATEDFAETFRAWETERGVLRSVAPGKHKDMKSRVG
ncbi:MAG: hypothetical protein ACOYNN_18190 [Terrimicrobiaceae bacterium]